MRPQAVGMQCRRISESTDRPECGEAGCAGPENLMRTNVAFAHVVKMVQTV